MKNFETVGLTSSDVSISLAFEMAYNEISLHIIIQGSLSKSGYDWYNCIQQQVNYASC